MSLYKLEAANIRKTWALMGAFLILVIAVGWALSVVFNDQAILFGAVLLSLLANWVSYWYSDKIALALARATPANRREHFELFTVVENLSIAAGLPMPKVYVIEDPAPNAFATGRNKEHAAVAATTGLLTLMNKTELEGVIAHELSHIGNRDILVATSAVVLAGLISIVSNWFLRMNLWGGMERGRQDNRGGNPIFLAIGFALILLAPLFATLLRLAVSRKREFLADASGALLTRYPEGLASALEKIGSVELPMRTASDATAHLYFSNPFGAESMRAIHRLFLTHPPIEERVRALREA